MLKTKLNFYEAVKKHLIFCQLSLRVTVKEVVNKM